MILYERAASYIRRTRECIVTAEGLRSRDPFNFFISKDRIRDKQLIEDIIRSNPPLDRADFLDAIAIASRIFLRDKIEALPDRV